jgi:hypothetical protein
MQRHKMYMFIYSLQILSNHIFLPIASLCSSFHLRQTEMHGSHHEICPLHLYVLTERQTGGLTDISSLMVI